MPPKKARDLKRSRNGEYTVSYDETHATWYATVSLGRDDRGKLIRRFVRGKTRDEVHEKVLELRERATRLGPQTAAARRSGTLAEWTADWLAGVKLTKKASTYNFYESNARVHVLPVLGDVRLSELNPERIERALFTMTTTAKVNGRTREVPVSASVRKACHRTLRACLGVAHDRGYIPTNPATHVKVPMPNEEEIRPLTRAEVLAVIDAARTSPMPARWSIALVLGLRQGEVLGLRFCDLTLDDDQPTIRVVQNRVRQRWEHGCPDPKACGPAASCPHRHRNSPFDTPKSRKGIRTIAVPAHLVPALREQKKIVARMRLKAGPDWTDFDLVFPGKFGWPQDHRSDARAWARLLDSAGVSPARLHDARHSAASLALYLGTPTKVLAESFGWGSDATKMADRYQHVADDLRQAAAHRMDHFLFGE